MKEHEIRPEDLFNKYLELSESDAETYFRDSIRREVPCCGCGSNDKLFEFTKSGFDFVSCNGCKTLFASPRPDISEFEKFYRESPSSEFWAKVFFPAVADARREKLFKPKAEQIADLCKIDGFIPRTIADIGAGYGILLEELKNKFRESDLIAVEPNPEMASVCKQKGLKVEENFVENLAQLRGEVDLSISLEVIEHVYEPLDFCGSVFNLLSDGGRALFTTLTISGFDLQVLWDKSRGISPPHHINFLSIEGLYRLMERAGFKNVKIFTPGKLDVDIVKNSLGDVGEKTREYRFIKNLIEGDAKTLDSFQVFLAENKLSSHCWVWAQK